MTATPPSVSLVVIATGRYHPLVPPLVGQAKRHLLGLRQIFVISDLAPRPEELVTWLPWGHMSWPYPTLLRYRAMTAYREILGAADVLIYLDVDMRIEREVELPRLRGTFAVQHPGYVEVAPEALPYERRAESTSCMPIDEGSSYVAGGVQGGHSSVYLDACATIAEWIQTDLSNGVVPLWHDESAWNRYCVLHPPELVLPASYCSPWYDKKDDAFIVALDKDSDHMRETPLSVRAVRVWHRETGRLIGLAKRSLKRLGVRP